MKMPLLLSYDFLLVCFCVCFSCFVLWKRPSAVLAIAILDWRAISRKFPNLHAFVIYLISRCCFMYWAWVKKMVFRAQWKWLPIVELFSRSISHFMPGFLDSPRWSVDIPSWDYIFPPSNLSPVFLHCMIKAPKLRGHLSLLVEAWRYVQCTIMGHSTWISRLNDYIVSCCDMTLQLSVWMSILILGYIH